MRWKWILGIIAFLIVAVTVAIYTILSSYDFNDLKPKLARMVKETTGRELFLGGDIELEIGLTPTLVIEDVSFQNVSWGSRPELAKITRLEIELAVLPLFRRIILFKRLILIDPDILIETNRAGKSNIEFETLRNKEVLIPKEQPLSNGKSILSALAFNDIRIEKGHFTYNGGQSGRTYTVNLESATASAGTDGLIALNLDGEYNRKPFRVKATLGSLTAFMDPDKTWPVKVTSQIAGSRVTIDGAARDPIKGKGLAITVTGTGRSIPEILKLFNITYIPEFGPFDVTAKLTDPEGRLGVTDIDLRVGGEHDGVRARVTGSIQDLIKGKGLSVTVTGAGRSIPDILELFNIRFIPELGPFDVRAKLVDPDGKLALSDLDLKVGGGDGVRARVTGSIQDLIKGKGLGITVTGTGPSIPEILKQYNITYIPELGPFDVRAKLVDPDGKLALSDLDLKVGGGDGVRARVTGSIQDLIKGKGLGITVAGTGPSIPEILTKYHITYIPELGPFDVTAKLVDPDGRLGLKDLDLKVGTEEMVKTRFMGTVENITAIKGMNLSVDIRGKDVANLEKITGKPMPLNGPFSVSGKFVALSAKSYSISDFKAFIQESDLNGSIEINLSGKKLRITADLGSEKLDLRPLLPKKGIEPGEPEKGSDNLSARKDKVFPDTPLPLQMLKQVDAEIELNAKRLLLTAFFLSDISARMVLENGHLFVNPLKLVTGGGTLDGHFDLHLQGKGAQVATALRIDQYELGSMLENMGISDSLHGNVDMKLDIEGRGNSIAELMSGLNGKTMVVMGEGRINQNAVKLLGSDLSSGLLQLLNPLKKKEKYTKINCFAGGFDIKNGLAQSSALVLDTPQVRVFGNGKIDFKTEEIDLLLNPIPQKGVGITGLAKLSLSLGELTKPLKFKGTLSKPSLSIDPTGSIITLGKAVGGVALFGPFGVAAILANGQFGNKNPCVAVIEAAEKEYQKSEVEKSEDKKSMIRKTTEGIGTGLKKLMGQ
jgi:uncharacterized protein involved in outer membrane biogenesis